jgi:hypothetical protein
MWILLVLAGVGGLLLWQRAAHAQGGAAPQVFTQLKAGQLYLLSVFAPPDMTDPVALMNQLTATGAFSSAGKVPIVGRSAVNVTTLDPFIAAFFQKSGTALVNQWAVPVLVIKDVDMQALSSVFLSKAYLEPKAFLITGEAKAKAQGTFGFHMNEPGFMSDQTDIYPIGYGGRGWVTDARRHRGYRE